MSDATQRPDAGTDGQADTVRFLAGAACHGGETPRHVETHLSHLFIAGERVLKLKKAIRWAMVDYATPERREHFCRRELAVNGAFVTAVERPVWEEAGERKSQASVVVYEIIDGKVKRFWYYPPQ